MYNLKFYIMLQLNLEVRDENGVKIDALSQDNIAPQQLNAVLMFLRVGYEVKVTVTNAEIKASSN